MKIFAIINESGSDSITAYLFYYEKPKKFYIELTDNADEWNTPILLSSFAKKNIKTVNSHWSGIWVEQRIVPSDRQNLAQILKDNGLKKYDEFDLLMLSNGRCAQDDFFLSPILYDDLPENIKNRRAKKIDDIVPLNNNKILIFFRNGKIKLCDLQMICSPQSPTGILLKNNPEAVKNVRLQVGGYGICWGDNMSISDSELYENGTTVPLTKNDFYSFVANRVVNTAGAAELLGCSRQNVEDLTKRKKITPIKEFENGKLFFKSEIEKREWE